MTRNSHRPWGRAPSGVLTRRTLPANALVALTMFKAAVLASVLTLSVGVGVGVGATAEQDGPKAEVAVAADSYTRVVQRIMDRHQCSTTGFAPETVPASALIRTNQGRLRVVSFDAGWSVFTGERPGSLVALCLGQEPPPGKPATGA